MIYRQIAKTTFIVKLWGLSQMQNCIKWELIQMRNYIGYFISHIITYFISNRGIQLLSKTLLHKPRESFKIAMMANSQGSSGQNRDLAALTWLIRSWVNTTSSALIRYWAFLGGPGVGFNGYRSLPCRDTSYLIWNHELDIGATDKWLQICLVNTFQKV